MNDSLDPILQEEEQRRLRQQLIWRLTIAIILVACVLGVLAWLEHNPQQTKVMTTSSVRIAPRPSLEPTITPEALPAATIVEEASAVAHTEEALPIVTATLTPTPTIMPSPIATPFLGLPAEPYLPAVPKTVHATATALPIAINQTIKQTLAAPTPKITKLPNLAYPLPVSSPNGFTVQAGVFLHASNAETMLRQVQSAGVPAYLETRVQIGPFKNKREAQAAIQKLRKLGLEPVIKPN